MKIELIKQTKRLGNLYLTLSIQSSEDVESSLRVRARQYMDSEGQWVPGSTLGVLELPEGVVAGVTEHKLKLQRPPEGSTELVIGVVEEQVKWHCTWSMLLG